MLSGTFGFGVRRKSKENIQNGTCKTDIPASKAGHTFGTTLLEPRPQSAIRPQSNTSQVRRRRSPEQHSTRTAVLATDCRIIPEVNTAKRRKTEGGTVYQASHTNETVVVRREENAVPERLERPSPSTPTVILPPVNRTTAVVRSQTNASTISKSVPRIPVWAPILPRKSQKAAPGKISQGVSPTRQPEVAPAARRAVSLAPRLQADKSRVSLDGRVQKPQKLSTNATSAGPENQKQYMDYVLRAQVFKHIKLATNQYRLSLSSEDRSKIGTKVRTAFRFSFDTESLLCMGMNISLSFNNTHEVERQSFVLENPYNIPSFSNSELPTRLSSFANSWLDSRDIGC